MAQSEKDYLSMKRQERIDLALSLDIHNPNAEAGLFKFLYRASETGDPDRTLITKQKAAIQFELNKDTNPIFRKNINERLKAVQWVADHIEYLTFIMLWDILSVNQPTKKDLTDKGHYPDAFIIEKKFASRILNDYYNYMHTKPVKWSPKMEKLGDDPRNFVFSFRGPRLTRPLPSKDKRLNPVGTLITGKKGFIQEIHLEDFADPYYLKRLFTFRKKVFKMLETIAQKTKIRKEFRWVIDELVHSDFALTILFQNAAREVEKRWFNEDLFLNSKVNINFGIYKTYTESEITQTIRAYKTLSDELSKKEFRVFRLLAEKVEANILEQITLAALYYANRDLIDVPRWLFHNLLEEDFKLAGKDKAIIEHNLGIFEMLNKQYATAINHFQSALTFWTEHKIFLLEEIDTWNLVLAFNKLGKRDDSEKQKLVLLNKLSITQLSTDLYFFLINQFADISDLFGEKSASIYWLERGLRDSVNLEDLFDLALYFEARLSSINILGSTKEQQNRALSKAQAMRDNFCMNLGDTGNFIVVIEKKFYLLRENLMLNELKN